MEEVLSGLRVLDCSRYKAGPACGQILGDMGAEVIRIERPGGEDDRKLGPFIPDGQSLYVAFTCRNKKAITLNLKMQKGRNILKELAKRSDVVIENFGPDMNKKLGLDYASLKKVRTDIIVVAVSAYGQYGPYARRSGFDPMAQALSGLMWVTGFPQGLPVRAGVSLVDTVTGFYAALGMMFALRHRDKTGNGQMVDVSLTDTAMSFMESVVAEYKVGGGVRPQVGNAHTFVAPYDAYKAKDGYFYLGIVGDHLWLKFLKVMGRDELAGDKRFGSDFDRAAPENRQFFADWLNGWAAKKTVKEIVEFFNSAGLPCAPVNTVPELAADPHIRARDMLVDVDHPGVGKVPLIGIPIKLSETPGSIKTIAPVVGEHNEEIYSGLLGYTREQIKQFSEEGII